MLNSRRVLFEERLHHERAKPDERDEPSDPLDRVSLAVHLDDILASQMCAQSLALIRGRDFVTPNNVKSAVPAAMTHQRLSRDHPRYRPAGAGRSACAIRLGNSRMGPSLRVSVPLSRCAIQLFTLGLMGELPGRYRRGR
jgi:hypothetical protein